MILLEVQLKYILLEEVTITASIYHDTDKHFFSCKFFRFYK